MTSIARVSQRRAMTGQAIADQPTLSFGVLYPENDVIAVIDAYRQAELGARALLNAGIPGDRIDVMRGRHFDTLVTAAKRRHGIIGRLGACLSRLFSDDADCEQRLLDEAGQNHTLLVVHAADPALAARTSIILRAFGAHDMRYYRRGSIEDLV